MDNFKLMGYVEKCIQQLSVEIGARPAGTPENQAAADFIAQEFKRAGYEVFRQEYPCPDWQSLSCELSMAGEKVPATVNTYSPSCDWEAEMVPVSSIEELARLNIRKKIAVLYGDITSSSILPTNFDRRYHQVEIQDRFMELLIKKRPAAIITVSHYDGLYPVVMEDSELNIPSVTVTRQDGLRILQNNSATARLKIISTCQKSSGANIIGAAAGVARKK